MTLSLNNTLSSITLNPFRVLGVFTNASQKDIVANSNKLKAFIKVGKTIEFNSDLNILFGEINRSDKVVSNALKTIELPSDKLRATLFWFVCETPMDKIAINHLKAGDIEKAYDIWSKVTNVSSLLNRMVCSILLGKWEDVVYINNRLCNDFSEQLCGMVDDTVRLMPGDIIRLFLHTIGTENETILGNIYKSFPDSSLPGNEYPIFNSLEEWRGILVSELIKPAVKRLEENYNQVKSIPQSNAIRREAGAATLLNNGDLQHLFYYLGKDDPTYISIGNKVVSEGILCVIDSYNHSEDQEDCAERIIALARIACQYCPTNPKLEQRCKDNYDKLEDICHNLPPKSVRYYAKRLKMRIRSFQDESPSIDNATNFIEDCAPYLMSIKNILGEKDFYLLKMSTLVARNALTDIIEDYNKQTGDIEKKRKMTDDKLHVLSGLMSDVIKKAFSAMYKIRCLNLEDGFKIDRFQPNFNTILKQANNWNILGTKSINEQDSSFTTICKEYELDMRGEFEYFNGARTVSHCLEYLHIFPNGRYLDRINKKIEEFSLDECLTLKELEAFKAKYPSTQLDTEAKKEEIIFESCQSFSDYRNYCAKYPKGKFYNEARRKIEDYLYSICRTVEDYQRYLDEFPSGRYSVIAKRNISDFNLLEIISHIQTFEEAMSVANRCKTTSTLKAIDEKAWSLCQNKEDLKLYLTLPEPIHKLEAEKKLRSIFAIVCDSIKQHKKWYLSILIVLLVTPLIYIVWGVRGYEALLFIIGTISGFATLGALFGLNETPKNKGCLTVLAFFIVAIAAFAGGCALEDYLDECDAYESLLDYPSSKKCEDFESRYPSSKHIEEIKGIHYKTVRANGPKALQAYAIKQNDPLERSRTLADVEHMCDSIYTIATYYNSIEGWEKYKRLVPIEYVKDADDRIEAIKNQDWIDESKAWNKAVFLNSKEGFEKYLEFHPAGAHKALADKKLIDLQVDEVMSGDYGELPSMDRTGYSVGTTSSINVFNNTIYNLTLLYSGSDSRRITIPPKGKRTISLKNGAYRCVASVDASGIGNYAGNEDLDGGSYEVEYYIVTSRSRY